MTKTFAILLLLVSALAANAQRRQPTPAARPSEPSDSPLRNVIRDIAVFTGQCRFHANYLQNRFFRCDDKVAYLVGNDRSMLTFTAGDSQFHLSGGSDRQPNLENYYLSIDTFAITKGAEQESEDPRMEGECHFRMNKTANKFFFVKCDIYDRSKGSLYNFYLENIRLTKHRSS